MGDLLGILMVVVVVLLAGMATGYAAYEPVPGPKQTDKPRAMDKDEILALGDLAGDQAVVEDDERGIRQYRDEEKAKYSRRVQMHLDESMRKAGK